MFQQTSTSPVASGGGTRPPIDPPPTLSGIARECMTAANWDVDKARERLLARLIDDEDLRGEALRIAVNQLLSAVGSGQRHQIFMKAVPAGKDDTRALHKMAAQSVLETYLIAGKRLGDCSPDELRTAIGRHKTTAATEEQRASFLTAVLKKLKPTTKRVRDELNEDDARRLARKFPC